MATASGGWPRLRGNPRDLAQRLAPVAHELREWVARALEGQQPAPPVLADLLAGYRATVDASATTAQFADALAQVAVYALFVARCQHVGTVPFSRRDVAHLPEAHPFLRALLDALGPATGDGEPFGPALDAAARLLAETGLAVSLDANYGDPIIAFYESFLRAYDPAQRGRRGVYLTPEPVVAYLVRSVDALLVSAFGLACGLAHCGPDPRVSVEDPACGTGAFLDAVLAHVGDRLQRTGRRSPWPEGLCSLLPRLRGCELLPAPYLVAHLIVGMRLAGLDMPGDEHVHITLGNALECVDDGRMRQPSPLQSPTRHDLRRLEAGATLPDPSESRNPVSSKRGEALVMLGNPPYAGHSANDGAAIAGLLRGVDPHDPDGAPSGGYFAVDGVPLEEHNLKWLNDDYVKFMRYAQWRIEHAGQGILAFVTSSGYLESPTFRGMRRSLMRSFDAMYLLDLGGSARLNQRASYTRGLAADDRTDVGPAPGGTWHERARPALPLHWTTTSAASESVSDEADASPRDENVFAIQQGVALALFVRRPGDSRPTREATVLHAELRGEREDKLRWLAAHSVADTLWQPARPQAPFFTFRTSPPRDADRDAEYAWGWPLPELLPEHSLGILTKRDGLVVGFASHELLARVQAFADPARSDADCAACFNLPLRDRDRWDLARARRELAGTVDPAMLRPLVYRPLDSRVVYYDPRLVARPNVRVMRHLGPDHANVALVVGRQGAATGSACWDAAFVTATLADQNLFRRGGGTVFPLYLFSDEHNGPDGRERRANLHPAFVAQLSVTLGLTWLPDGSGDLASTLGPEDVVAYVYALLYAPSYRARYAGALRTDFPRIPLTGDLALFRALCHLGQQLLALHLLEPSLERVPASLPCLVGRGTNHVERVRYGPPDGADETGCVWINATQRVVGITPSVWAFSTGGYRVAEKWLADRRGRILTDEELRRYQQLFAVLGETRTLMRRIDAAIAAHGGWPLAGTAKPPAGA